MRRVNPAWILSLTLLPCFATGCADELAFAGIDGDDETGGEQGAFDDQIPDGGEGADPQDTNPDDEDEDDGLGEGAEEDPDEDDGDLGEGAGDDEDEQDEYPHLQPDPFFCGNGQLDEGEACDDQNDDQSDGCLSNCTLAQTCLHIKEHDETVEDGFYTVAPGGMQPFDVYCDMSTDGGGYSFLKIDAGKPTNAAEAEAECGKWGMQLLIPRTLPHLYSAYRVATDLNIFWGANPDYLRILGIYPNELGSGCAYMALTSSNELCEWSASDGGPFWISEKLLLSHPKGMSAPDESMAYAFDDQGWVEDYAEISGGATSQRFTCDFGDKQ